MSERRYTEEEVAAIFERAAAADHTRMPATTEKTGLTLEALQDIGREVGLAPEAIALAARSIDQSAPPVSRSLLGLPIRVGVSVELERVMTDAEWGQFVGELRTTFEARGAVRYDGPFRQWTNGNLQALVEPTAEGHRVRLQTTNGQARSMIAGGAAMLGMAAAVGLASIVTGNPEAAGSMSVLAAVGGGLFGLGALRLPGWARRRRAQFEALVQRLTSREP